jgi:DNA-binding NtrC family response regulator
VYESGRWCSPPDTALAMLEAGVTQPERNAEGILVVDDDPDILVAARLLLKRHFTEVVTCDQLAAIPALVQERSFAAVLLDMNFGAGERSGREGLAALSRLLELDRELVVILITAHSSVETAVDAIKLGATDFVTKPWQNDKLVATVRAGVELRRSRLRARQLEAHNRELAALSVRSSEPFLGQSPAMRRVFEVISKAAPTDANVLILGENGTGKELVARQLHRESARKDRVFVSVDLGAVSESLIESELFGHRKGAFTGADEHRVGRFQAASGGTIFLDEVGNLPRHLQSKLLTALERREVVPVGANAPVPVDLRVVAATNLTRQSLFDDAVFRQDLLYRLNTVEVELPPLRDRPEDIPLLAAHFLALYARKYGRAVRALEPAALRALSRHAWPGNVRALRHAVERAVILAERDALGEEDFALLAGAPRAELRDEPAAPETLAALERRAIEQALARHGGNVTHAAHELGITRTSLYRRMEKHGLG